MKIYLARYKKELMEDPYDDNSAYVKAILAETVEQADVLAAQNDMECLALHDGDTGYQILNAEILGAKRGGR